MARFSGYIIVKSGKITKAAYHSQGNVSDKTDEVENREKSRFGSYGSYFTKIEENNNLKDGLYKATYYANGGGRSITLGKRVTKPEKEIAKLAEGNIRTATTGMPGISGYQKMADVASHRLMNLDTEKKRMAKWLERNLS